MAMTREALAFFPAEIAEMADCIKRIRTDLEDMQDARAQRARACYDTLMADMKDVYAQSVSILSSVTDVTDLRVHVCSVSSRDNGKYKVSKELDRLMRSLGYASSDNVNFAVEIRFSFRPEDGDDVEAVLEVTSLDTCDRLVHKTLCTWQDTADEDRLGETFCTAGVFDYTEACVSLFLLFDPEHLRDTLTHCIREEMRKEEQVAENLLSREKAWEE